MINCISLKLGGSKILVRLAFALELSTQPKPTHGVTLNHVNVINTQNLVTC